MCKISIQEQGSNTKTKSTASTKGMPDKKRGRYNKFSNLAQVQTSLQKWWDDAPSQFKPWCAKNTLLSRTTLAGHLQRSGLSKMQQSDTSYSKLEIEKVINVYLQNQKIAKSTRCKKAHESSRYLTDKEEESIVNLCFTLASMGFGVSQDDVVQLINEYINLDEPDETRVSISSKIFRTMRARHPGLMKLVSAGSS